ncbi:MAG TPA: cupin domain-containing protein [Bdellovibrionota bacterium]|nr:cupin domain-containing protein [Bdellovibrionota bacterium]
MDWKNIVNLEKLEFVQEGKTRPYEYEVAPAALASALGAQKLGFNVSILPPGQFTCPYHFHHSEEELFLVLDGKCMLRQAGKFREVGKGDLIFFTTSPEGAHQFYNHTSEPCTLFAISTKDPLEVAEYPDSGKIMVGKLRKVFKAEDTVEYLRDEEDPSVYWPKEFLGN